MAPDPNGRVVLFGGRDDQSAAGRSTLGDTWTWDGTRWSPHRPTNPPHARYGAAMAYHPGAGDPGSGRTVLFGGYSPGSPVNPDDASVLNPQSLFGDTWAWDGASWQDVTPEVCKQDPPDPLQCPSPRYGAALAEDAAGNLVLFGGTGGLGDIGDTWTWDGKGWENVTPLPAPAGHAATSPPPRSSRPALAYDSANGQTVLFGGRNAAGDLADTWTWDGLGWENATPPPPASGESPTSPPARRMAGMALHDSLGLVVLFGGQSGGQSLRDTWAWDGQTKTWVERHPAQRPPSDTVGNGMAYHLGGGPGAGAPLGHVVVLSSSVSAETPAAGNVDGRSFEVPVSAVSWTWDGQTRAEMPDPEPPGPPDSGWRLTLDLHDAHSMPKSVLLADGRDTLTATAEYTIGENPASGQRLEFSTTGDVAFQPATTCVTDPNGRCSVTVRASVTPGDETIRVIVPLPTGGNALGDAYATLTEIEVSCGDQSLPERGPDGWWANLDSRFGCHGRAFPHPLGNVTDMVRQADGKIVVTTAVGLSASYVMRYMPDGSLDPEFGAHDPSLASGGAVRLPHQGVKLRVQPDEKIVVLMWEMSTDPTKERGLVSRFNKDGSPDNGDSVADSTPTDGFGVLGMAVAIDGRPADLDLQEDAKIVVAATRRTSASVAGGADGVEAPGTDAAKMFRPAAVVSRLNPDGSRDNGEQGTDNSPDDRFGDEGEVVVSYDDTGFGSAGAIAIQPHDHKIVVAGGFSRGWGFARLLPTGALDGTFNPCPAPEGGCDGTAVVTFGATGGGVEDLAIQSSDQKILGVGDGDGMIRMVRLTSDGIPDGGFNPCGPAPPPCGGRTATEAGRDEFGSPGGGRSIALQDDEKIVVGGIGRSQNRWAMMLLRYNPDGTPDETCGLPPKAFISFTGAESAAALAVEPDGNILAAGLRHHILRLEGGGPSLFNKVSIGDLTVTEPPSGSTPGKFILSLDAPACAPISVDWATDTGNSNATAGQDFTASSGTATLKAGDTSIPVEVPVLADDEAEGPEHFVVKLSNPRVDTGSALLSARPRDLVNSPITLRDPVGVATIFDPSPTVGVGDLPYVPEPDTGPVDVFFTLTLGHDSQRTVTVPYATVAGKATAGKDYETTSGTATFAPGETTTTVRVRVLPDTEAEDPEELYLDLGEAKGAFIGRARGTARIFDAPPGISVGDATVVEGDTGTTPAMFPVVLNGTRDQRVTVAYTTTGASAEPGADFVPASGTITFPPGDNQETIVVNVVADTLAEDNEDYSVVLSAAAGAVVARATGTGIILDDDDGPIEEPPVVLGAPAAPTVAPTNLPPPATINTAQPQAVSQFQAQTQAQSQLQSQAQQQAQAQHQAQQQAQSQAQQQVQQQSQVQVNTQAQTQSQGALMTERQRSAEVEHELAAPDDFLASARRPGPVTALAWAAVPLGFALAHRRRRSTNAAVSCARVPGERRGR